MSIGVAEYPYDANTSYTLIDIADQALYQAKHQDATGWSGSFHKWSICKTRDERTPTCLLLIEEIRRCPFY
jgi:GGDEF domain-containing protein